MSEAKAIVLIQLAMLLACGAIVAIWDGARANGTDLFLAVIGPLMVGAYLSSRVVMHYGRSKQDRR